MDWEQHYQDGHTPWNKGAPAPPLQEWIKSNPDAIGGSVLVPGCGHGHDVHELASATEATEIVGIDISPSAVESAGKKSRSDRTHFELADLFNLPDTLRNRFDWVWEHTCFCAIDPALRSDYVDGVHGALKPDGRLLAVFYLNPYDNDHPRGGGPPHGTSEDELKQLFVESGKFELLESYVPAESYAGRESLELTALLKKK